METSFTVGLGIFTHQMKRCKALTNNLHSLSLWISYDKIHCVKNAPVRSFSPPYLFVFNSNAENYGPQKLRNQTLFNQ